MIKKIKTNQLRLGMFIHDFNCGWLQHPFFSRQAKIKTIKNIEKIMKSGIQELYIDTDRGLDVSDEPDGPDEQEISSDVSTAENDTYEIKPEEGSRVPLAKEIVRAKEIKKEAIHTVQSIMGEVRFGEPVKTEKVEPVVEKMVDSIFRNQDALISLGRIKKTDEYTFMHSMSVCVLMISFGKHLGFDSYQLKEVGVGGMLHDIGKMMIPQNVLNKNSALTDEEYAQMKEHVQHSHVLLKETPGISEIAVLLASEHHERIDGSGYPSGLRGDEISIYGQAAAIADVYDAMTSQRCYQRRFEPTEVLKKLFEWNGAYNEKLVQQFIKCIGIYPVGSLVNLESGLLGIVLNHNEVSLLHPVVRIVYDTKKDQYISPYDIDLSNQPDNEGGDKVKCWESSEKWNIQTEKYL